MSERRRLENKSARNLGYQDSVRAAPSLGWNPFIQLGDVVRFRCAFCGTLMGVSTRDTESEWEGRCPICGHVHVFNRQPWRWGTQNPLSATNERMLIQGLPAAVERMLRGRKK